jgi:transcription factor STE12
LLSKSLSIAVKTKKSLICDIRHRRTHEQQQNGEPVSFSEEDLENEEDQLVALEEESPESEHAYLNMPTSTSDIPTPMTSMSTGTNNMNGATMNGTSIGTPHMIAAHNY